MHSGADVKVIPNKAQSHQNELDKINMLASPLSTPSQAVRPTIAGPPGSRLRTQLQGARDLREALNIFDNDDETVVVSILKTLNTDISNWAGDLAGKIVDTMTFGNGVSVGRIVQHPRFKSAFTLGNEIQSCLGPDNREDGDIIEFLSYYSLCSLATQTLLEHIFIPFHPTLYPVSSTFSTINLITLSKRVQVRCKCAISVSPSGLFLTCL